MTKTNRNAWAFLAASTLAIAVSGAVPVHAESLRDAIALAYAQNPTLARQRAQQRATDESYVQARSGMGPAVGAGLSDNYSRSPQALGGTVSTVTGSVSLNQTLFTSGNLASQLTAANATVKAGQESLRSVEEGVLLDVISAYTAVRRDQEALEISQTNYNVLKQQLNQTQAQFDAGQLTRTDVAQSQARLSQSEASLAQAQARLDTDRATYVQVVGQAPTALEAEPDLPGLPADFNSALAAAESNNPDLGAAQYAAAAAHARVGEARSAFGPQVSLSASTDQVALANHLGSSVNESSAGLRLSIPL
ncbi:MAG: TolC family protein, partial [Asticcacaulis sp.]